MTRKVEMILNELNFHDSYLDSVEKIESDIIANFSNVL